MSGFILTGLVLFLAWLGAVLMVVRSIVGRSSMPGRDGLIRFSRFDPAECGDRRVLLEEKETAESRVLGKRYESSRSVPSYQQFKNRRELKGVKVMASILQKFVWRPGQMNDVRLDYCANFSHLC